MEAALPAEFELHKTTFGNTKIVFIEELKINEIYNIKFGIKENKNELLKLYRKMQKIFFIISNILL